MVQLFSNLLDNAITHGPVGGTVRISLSHSSSTRVSVCIHDDGGNIPPDALGHLFDRFYRVDSARAHATGGTGLGLAIARLIAQRHGGDIEITSDPADGTDVTVWLPLATM
ncbi:MAG: sensor histidine kinase [Planctomycetota bacterium]|nr:sensor histidine kinase [Planctomycetota bacterium]